MRVDYSLRAALGETGRFDASACLNCGTCTTVCPLGLEEFPRRVFRYALLGDREHLLAHTEDVYSCLLCKMCEANCPAGVHVTENVRRLRNYLGREFFHLTQDGR